MSAVGHDDGLHGDARVQVDQQEGDAFLRGLALGSVRTRQKIQSAQWPIVFQVSSRRR